MNNIGSLENLLRSRQHAKSDEHVLRGLTNNHFYSRKETEQAIKNCVEEEHQQRVYEELRQYENTIPTQAIIAAVGDQELTSDYRATIKGISVDTQA